MRMFAAGAAGARTAFRLVVPVALLAAGAGSVLAAGPAAAAVHRTATSSCTVTFLGKDFPPRWTDPKNWSTGKVPGATDDVCINVQGTDVLTPVSIKVHSLELGTDAGIALEGTASNPVTATVATSVTMKPGEITRIDMTDATIKAAQISDQGGTIFTDGNCNLTSPDVVFGSGSDVQAANGTTTLASLSGLSNGTLTGASFTTDNATVALPGDITHLVSANISVGENSAIDDAQGHNALIGLSSIDAQSSLTDFNNLTLASSSFTAVGNVTFGSGTVAIGGPYTQAKGTLTLDPDTVLSASPVTIGQGALLNDGGTITADLVNDGSVMTEGTARVTQNYTQAGGGSLASGFGNLLTVAGTATLAGSVSASELLTHTRDTTQLITFGALSGNFTSHGLGLLLITRQNAINAVVLPQIAVSPMTVAPGHAVTVTGGGFTYPETVRIFLDHAHGTPLATAAISIRGDFTATVAIPAATAAGSHRLIAVETDGNRATATITVR